MALTLEIGTTTKRTNSMLVPSLDSSISVVLKDATSEENPVFLLQGAYSSAWNYAHCAELGRYYWIEDASYNKGVWAISCRTDYLATYKSEILANTCYVTRSASLYQEDLTDALFPCGSRPQLSKAASDLLEVSNTGSIIICTAGKSGNAFYGCNIPNFMELMNYLYSSDYLTALNNFVELPQDVAKEIAHPEEYLLSAIWVPISLGGTSAITLGYVTTPAVGQPLSTGRIWGQVITVSVPKHPNSEGYSYRNLSPFSRYSLSLPFYGTVPIAPEDIANVDKLSIGYAADITGALQITIFTPKKLLYILNSNFGSPVGISSRSTNMIGTVSSITTGALTAAATGNPLGLAGAVVSGINNIFPHVSSSGGTGGTMVLDKYAALNAIFYIQKTVDVTHFGRPLCQPVVLSSLSGYCKTEEASVACSATETGKNEINRMLDGGIYIE